MTLEQSRKEILNQCKRLEREERIKTVAYCPKCNIPYSHNHVRTHWNNKGICLICETKLIVVKREIM